MCPLNSKRSLLSDLGMLFAIRALAFHDFAFFKSFIYCKSRLLKREYYVIIFVIWENEILILCDPDSLFFRFLNSARDPLYDPL